MSDRLKVLPQYLMPKLALTRMAGSFASKPMGGITTAAIRRFVARYGEQARDSARLYLVPGMNHSLGGPATDQFDLVEALVAWTERGQAPQAIEATARGPGSLLPNPEVPADWSPRRSRPLCPWPPQSFKKSTIAIAAVASGLVLAFAWRKYGRQVSLAGWWGS